MNNATPTDLYEQAMAHHQAGRNEIAVDLLSRAIAILPNAAQCHASLSVALCGLGRVDDAITSAEKAIALDPALAEGHFYLAYALIKKGRADRAISVYRNWLATHPDDWPATINLGNAHFALGQMDEATACFQKAAAIRPDSADAFFNLGNVHLALGRYDQAICAFRHAVEINPKSIQAHNNLGAALFHRHMLDEAMESLNLALALGKNFAQVHLNIGEVLKQQGLPDEACASFKRAIELSPADPSLASNYVFALQYCPDVTAEQNLAELKQWNLRYAQPLSHLIQTHNNDRSPNRRLRIGYVSADFRDHVAGLNLLPLLQHRDRKAFEIFCFSNCQRVDKQTTQFKSLADAWRDIALHNDDQAAQIIRNDQIDILIDLSAHASGNRLPLFARKPAPIQAMIIIYPGSTGLHTVDYRITDPHLDPPGETDRFYTEESIRLPGSFWCFDPATMVAVPDDVGPLPALKNGFFTFGCLNNFCKTNDRVLDLWSRVLRTIPDSRLIVNAPTGSTRHRVIARFRDSEIDHVRIEFVDRQARSDYFRLYHRIDIVLDTFPYNGHTTSLDAFWMGVPVVTLLGQTVVGRAGWSQLCTLNLRKLAARTPDQFVQIAVDLAGDRARLSELRRGLRDRMRNSPLCDAPGFTRHVESAYRLMWQKWCAR